MFKFPQSPRLRTMIENTLGILLLATHISAQYFGHGYKNLNVHTLQAQLCICHEKDSR